MSLFPVATFRETSTLSAVLHGTKLTFGLGNAWGFWTSLIVANPKIKVSICLIDWGVSPAF